VYAFREEAPYETGDGIRGGEGSLASCSGSSWPKAFRSNQDMPFNARADPIRRVTVFMMWGKETKEQHTLAPRLGSIELRGKY